MNNMKLKKGQRVRITLKADDFEDYGKTGVFVSMASNSYYYFYIEGSNNNKYTGRDRYGNKITWQLPKSNFIVIDEQLLFNFMYEE